jgi:hypothetical protein
VYLLSFLPPFFPPTPHSSSFLQFEPADIQVLSYLAIRFLYSITKAMKLIACI